jgi:tryptophan synthase alpha chain
VSRRELERALAQRRHHVSPFLMLGDPTPALSVALATAAVAAGASMLELGFPFSDPCADGPAIEAAALRARQSGVSTAQAFALLERVRAACPGVPLNLLVYGNLVHARGPAAFCRDAVAAGASSLLVPDLPLEEGSLLGACCRDAGLCAVQLVGPATPPARAQALAEASDAFVYLAAHQGTTGEPRTDDQARAAFVARTARTVAAPLCVGFGLRSRAQIRQVFAAGAAIAVVGSHLALVVERHWRADGDGRDLLAAFASACKALTTDAADPHAAADFTRRTSCS